eukprot:5794350-Pyramimonas_sp.AAC.1
MNSTQQYPITTKGAWGGWNGPFPDVRNDPDRVKLSSEWEAAMPKSNAATHDTHYTSKLRSLERLAQTALRYGRC